MGLILSVQPKAPQIAPQRATQPSPPPLETEDDRDWIERIRSARVTAYIRAELRAMDACAEQAAWLAKLARQRAWLADPINVGDRLFLERQWAHLDAQVRAELGRVNAWWAVRDAIRLWADLPDDRRRVVDQGDPGQGVALLPALTKAAALDDQVDPGEIMARFPCRVGLSVLCGVDELEGWTT